MSYYDGHLVPVDNYLQSIGAYDLERAAGYLHDILEDTLFPPEALELFPYKVHTAVLLLTRREDQTYREYMDGIMGSRTAMLVKWADSSANLAASLVDKENQLAATGAVSERTLARIERYTVNVNRLTRSLGPRL
ncbi:MAG TPA: hypothetical protein VLS45_02875 [Methylomicrobium sp.]|nr:hypothetical protein [Methylomicrobium sp.]